MGQHDIEDYFKSKLDGHTRDLDTERIWNELDLDKNKKRRRFLFWFVFAGLGVALTTSYFVHNYYTENTSQGNSSSVITHQKSKPQTKVSKTIAKESTKTINIIPKEIQVEKTNSKTFHKKKTSQYNSTTSQNTGYTSVLSNNSRTIEKSDGSLKKSKSPLVVTSIKSLNKKRYANNSSSEIITKSSLAIINNLSNRPTREITYDKYPYLISDLKYSKIDSKNRQRWTLGIYSGIYKINRTLQSSDQQLDNHLNTRSSSERSLEMLSTGISASYRLEFGLTLHAGLEYARINEEFNYKTSKVDTLDNSTALFQLYSTQTSRQSWTHFNKHQMIALPIGVGYNFSIAQWEFGLKGKMLFAFHNGFNGVHLDVDGSVTENPSYYSSDIKYGYSLSADLSRRLNSKWILSLQPSYQVYETSFVNSASGFTQYYKLLGINMGIGFQF